MARQVAKRETPVLKKENRLQRTFRETIAELRKVVWPTRDEAVRLTGIVVAVVVAMSAFLGAVDYFFAQVARFLLTR